jgi:hypothetical protein
MGECAKQLTDAVAVTRASGMARRAVGRGHPGAAGSSPEAAGITIAPPATDRGTTDTTENAGVHACATPKRAAQNGMPAARLRAVIC